MCVFILTCVCPHVPLQIEGVVESFATEPTGMPLHQTVALQVTSQHALQREHLVAHGAHKAA